jgi:alpha-ketoglutarate-dependent taurine dioxygenase
MSQPAALNPPPAPAYPPMTKAERDLIAIDTTDRFADFGLVAERGDADAADWMQRHRDAVLERVARRGWCVVRGLDVLDTASFRKCIARLGLPLVDDYGDLPMLPSDDGTTGVFNVTKYPAKNAILFHHEGSHTPTPPRHIFFQCTLPAQEDGETPLVDAADLLAQLPAEIRAAFAERGLLYRRSFVEGFDVTWQTFFRTEDRTEVEERCAREGVTVLWQPDGSLAIETPRPAVIRHPDSGRDVFFNQVLLHHPACLEPAVRSGLRALLKGRSLPRDVAFGDGQPIPDEWIAEVLRAHLRIAACFRWQAGDVVIADNYAVSHARCTYKGPRQHHVILSRP